MCLTMNDILYGCWPEGSLQFSKSAQNWVIILHFHLFKWVVYIVNTIFVEFNGCLNIFWKIKLWSSTKWNVIYAEKEFSDVGIQLILMKHIFMVVRMITIQIFLQSNTKCFLTPKKRMIPTNRWRCITFLYWYIYMKSIAFHYANGHKDISVNNSNTEW